jgi:hypothetical protein
MAARKRIDPLKAKAAKQKKIAIGGMAVLCLLLVIQGPKTLKLLKGPEPTPVAAPAAPNPAAPVPGTDAPAPADGAVAPGGAVDLSSLADSDLAPVAGDGQLVTFERFASKDPFAPQAVVTPNPVPAAPADEAEGDGGAEKATPGERSGAVDGGFTPAPEGSDASAGGGSPTPTAPALASQTSISINGVAEDVELEKSFPEAEPTFVLVSLAKNGKSVEIGIAGGTYAGGGQTIELKQGGPLTLQNTADGTRYELELLAVAGFPVPKPKR